MYKGFRCTFSGNIIYAVKMDLSTFYTVDDIRSLLASGETVILIQDIENLTEHFEDYKVEVVE